MLVASEFRAGIAILKCFVPMDIDVTPTLFRRVGDRQATQLVFKTEIFTRAKIKSMGTAFLIDRSNS